MSKDKFCLITNDVETTSILNHKLRDKTGEYVLNQGMPRLLDLYDKYGVKATFFFTGHIATLYPQVVKMAYERGHEVGSHGLTHEVSQAFDVLTPDEQLEHLRQSKQILEGIIGDEVISFRAPAARVDEKFPQIMKEAGFKVDSSVASQRLDMFFSFGALKKLHWITAPRKVYLVNEENIFKKGDSEVMEVPISAMGFPYIGTFMRIAPGLNRMTRRLLYWETLCNGRQFVFLTHPNEFIDEDWEGGKIQRRASNYFSYLMGDVLRHKLKVKNLGEKALPIFERELEFFQRKNFDFLTCKDLYNIKIK
ncbi:MAG: polysaccharide deacetylase family protein [Bacteroidaceae bacterium]|nr:polysaccharide deacetylase family protein [Bacteroidaceae bacterium]